MSDQPDAHVFDARDLDQSEAALAAAVTAIRDGKLVVTPTDTVYGIAADAFAPDAVARLLAAKGRGREMPPPVLISAPVTLEALGTNIPAYARTLVETYWPGALTIVVHAQSSLQWDLGETRGTVACRMPRDELTLELLSRTGPLAVSSANVSGMPAATSVVAAQEMLGDSVAVYLDGGPSTGSEPSTIIDCTGPSPRMLREGAISATEIETLLEVYLDEDAAEGSAPDA